MKVQDLFEAVDKSNWLYSFPVDLTNVDGQGFDNDAAVDKYIAKLEKKLGVKADVLEYDGPGGGWPEVMFTGTLPAMEKFLTWYHGDDKTEISSDIAELKRSNSYWDSEKKKRTKNK